MQELSQELRPMDDQPKASWPKEREVVRLARCQPCCRSYRAPKEVMRFRCPQCRIVIEVTTFTVR